MKETINLTIAREDSLIQLTASDNSNISQNLTDKMDKAKHKNSTEIPSKQFDNFLIESIDETLALLGVSVKNALYLRLEVNFNMEKNDIPQRLEEFLFILHRIFNLGASRLEVKFLKNLGMKIPVRSKCIIDDWSVSSWIEKDMSFMDAVKNKREEFLKTK